MTRKMKMLLAASAALLLIELPAASARTGDPEKPTAYLVADAHLDTQWNWDVQTTIREYVWNTLNQNLFLLKKYPRYVFNFEGGVKYSWMKEYYPREYEELKEFVRTGRWHISGASWDATDALVPSPESAIRNILLGQEFYRSEFGVESTDIFLPDCFGFGWTLPTIARHCGLIGFSSQKLQWRSLPFHDGEKYPFTVGLWKGIDGAEIMFAHCYDYNHRWTPGEDLTRSRLLTDHIGRSPLRVVNNYYGVGDIGGSPTPESVEAVERSLDCDGPIRIVSAASDRLFKRYLPFEAHPELPVYDGELLMDLHGTGCYTSQGAMKLYNRQNELLGDASERASVAADLLGRADYPSENLTAAWRRFIYHQFHDDLTGTSIPRAYEFSWNDELLTLKQFSDILTASVSAVSDLLDTRTRGIPLVCYNALGHAATDLVEVTVDAARCPARAEVIDARGWRQAAQLLSYADGKAHLLFEATVPANGYAVYDLRLSGSSKPKPIAAETRTVENSVYRIAFDEAGDIVSIIDKRCGRELVKEGRSIRLALRTEVESFAWPAWEIHKRAVDAAPAAMDAGAEIFLVEDGALRKSLRVEKRCGESTFRQYIRLYEGALADRIDFFNEVDWHSTALLKAEFPLNLANDTATYDLGIGSVKRGSNRDNAYEVYAQRWADLTDRSGAYGVTVMNDCKYGWDKPDDHTLRLTLLYTPRTERNYAYQNHQDFGFHTFTYSLTGHAGGLRQARTSRAAGVLNQRIKAFIPAKHAGRLGRSFSLASSDNGQVEIKALKRAESSDEYVVRIYETGGEAGQQAELTFAAEIEAAVEADGTEKTIGTASFEGNRLRVSVDANSLKTYKVRLRKSKRQTPPCRQLALAFDKKCFSWNAFAGDADFESGYGYAAELIPSQLRAGRTAFRLENKELLNGMKCEGDTLVLPANHGCNRLYLLAASATADRTLRGTLSAGGRTCEIEVPSYTGFIGQWGHTGHTRGYLYDQEVAYVGTHRHSSRGDHPYEFTYMFKYGIDLPAGTSEVVLPDNPGIVIFAAALVQEDFPQAVAASTLFRTSIKPSAAEQP